MTTSAQFQSLAEDAAPTSNTAILIERLVPIRHLMAAQGLAAIFVGLAPLVRVPGWCGAIAGVAVALPFLVRVQRRPVFGWLALWVRYSWRKLRKPAATPHHEAFDFESPDGTRVGLHWDGDTLVSLVRVEERTQTMTVMEPGVTVSGESVSLRTLVKCLRQFDIRLAAIDVISQGVRSPGTTHMAAVYEAAIGPLPAIADRTVWVVIRLDPTMCADAAGNRGGGWNGVLRTAVTATRRVANHLADAGLQVQVIAASDITKVSTSVTDLVGARESWSHCSSGRTTTTSFAIEPRTFSTEGLGLLWAASSRSTTVCLSLRRDPRRGSIAIRGLVRYDDYRRHSAPPPGVRRLHGQQHVAMASTLPLSRVALPVPEWVISDEAVDRLELPVAGCGQLLGADEDGRAVALPLFGPRVGRVELCGGLALAQQVVFRSLALGAHVKVHTHQPHAWQSMVSQVADTARLGLSDDGRGIRRAGGELDYSIEVFDGVAEHPVRAEVTTMIVRPAASEPTAESDVSLQVLDARRDLIRVVTRTGQATVTMVATNDEMRYLTADFATAS